MGWELGVSDLDVALFDLWSVTVCPPGGRESKNFKSGILFLKCHLHISYKDHVTNEDVRAKIQQATGPHEDLLTTVKRRKLHRYGHVSRSSGLAKTILQGTVKGGR